MNLTEADHAHQRKYVCFGFLYGYPQENSYIIDRIQSSWNCESNELEMDMLQVSVFLFFWSN